MSRAVARVLLGSRRGHPSLHGARVLQAGAAALKGAGLSPPRVDPQAGGLHAEGLGTHRGGQPSGQLAPQGGWGIPAQSSPSPEFAGGQGWGPSGVELASFLIGHRGRRAGRGSRGTRAARPSLPRPPPTGTSNWSEDYFSSTSGVGLVVSQRAPGTPTGASTVQEQLRHLFERDWDSHYAVGLDGQAQGQDCVWQG